MEKKTIGAFIAALRKASGLTQKQLAEKLNVSDKAVSRWERDEAMPDLTLIPVIAEIFNVTSDEILRGQRKVQEEPDTKYEIQRSEKQIQYMLKKAETDYTIVCFESIAVAVMGLIAAMIGNLGFLRAYIGFFVSCVFFVGSVLFQSICLIQGLQRLDYSEKEEQTSIVRKNMILWSELSYSICCILFAVCLPLVTMVCDTYAGLSIHSWLHYGSIYALIAAVTSLAICSIINFSLQYIRIPDFTTPKNKLRLHTAVILAAFLLVTAFIQNGLIFGLFESDIIQALNPGTKWESWEELKEFLETPLSPDGEEMTLVSKRNDGYNTEYIYIAPDGNYHYLYDVKTVLVYEADLETPKYEYVRRNLSVACFQYSNTEDHLPIYTLNSQQYQQKNAIMNQLRFWTNMIYLLIFGLSCIIYRIKAKKLKAENH